MTRRYTEKQKLNKQISDAAELLINRFNHSVKTQMVMSDFDPEVEQEMQSTLKSEFIGADNVKIKLEIDPDLNLSIERLGKTLYLKTDEENLSYSLRKNNGFAQKKVLETINLVNDHLSNNALQFKRKAQIKSSDELPMDQKLPEAFTYTRTIRGRISEATQDISLDIK